MSAPKEFWELEKCLTKLRSDDQKQQHLAAMHLKAHAIKEARIRTSQEFNIYMEEICKNIHDFCESYNRNERMGGILLIRNLVDVVYAEHDLHLQKLGRYLQKIIDNGTNIRVSVSDNINEIAAETLGKLVQANPTSADIFEREVKQAFKWLASGNSSSSRNEYNVYMAMLIIRELAKAAPTLFNEYVPQFLESVWVGITDYKAEIRETSKLALRQVLVLIGGKRAVQAYHKLFSTAKQKIVQQQQSKSSSGQYHVIHGAILVIGELLSQDKKQQPTYIIKVYGEICQLFFAHKDARLPLLKETIITLMPKLAHFNPILFSKRYLESCVRHIIQEHKLQTVSPQVTYSSLGGVALAVKHNIMPMVPPIITVLDEGLTRTRKGRSSPAISHSTVATEALRCIALLAKAVGPLLGPHATDLVDKMIKSDGLTAPHGAELVRALTALVDHVKDQRLLSDIQKRLLAAIFQILTPSAALPTSILGGANASAALSGGSISSNYLSTNSAASADAVSAAASQYLIPSDIGIMADVLKILRSSSSPSSSFTAADHQHDSKIKDPAVVRLALNTLGTFNFDNIRLLWFVCQCLIRYLDHPKVAVREAAAVACSNLLLRPNDPYLKANLAKTHYRAMIYRVLEQLLTVGVADPMPRIRQTVINALHPRFDAFLAQAENLHALFVALNDENFPIRAAAISVIGRLALKNPAYVMPSLRKSLIHLLTQIQYGVDSVSQEQSCRLLGHLVESSEMLTKPYLPAILKVLLPSLKKMGPTTTAGAATADPRVVSCVVETLGKLEKVGGLELRAYLPDLLPFLLGHLKNRGQAHSIEREVVLKALGKLIRATGNVILPYVQYPELLPTLLRILSTEVKWEARLEALKVLGILGALDPYQHKINEAKLRDAAIEAANRKGQSATTMGPHRALLKMYYYKNKNTTAAGGTRTAKAGGGNDNERAGRVSVNPTRVTDDRYLLPSMVGSLDEYYSTVAMNALMRVLADPTLSSQHNSVMKSATYVFRSLGPKCAVFLPRIIPTLLAVLRNTADEQNIALQKQVLERLQELVSIVGKHMRPYLHPIFEVIYTRWTRSRTYDGALAHEVLALVETISLALREEFKFYLPDLIPHFLRALHGSPPPAPSGAAALLVATADDKKKKNIGVGGGGGAAGGVAIATGAASVTMTNSSNLSSSSTNAAATSGGNLFESKHHHHLEQRILETMQTFGSNLEEYLHLVIPTLMKLAESQDVAQSVGETAVQTVGKLCTNLDFRDYISCIVHPTARILAGARDSNHRDKVMAMLLAVIRQVGVDFLLFVPLINKALEVQTRNAQLMRDQKEKARLAACVDSYDLLKDIIMRGETPTTFDLNKALSLFNGQKHLSWDRERKIVREMAAREKPTIFERSTKLTIDVNALSKAWECQNKLSKEDWQQWMTNFMVKLLEFSPSTSLRPCVTLAKRDRSLARDLFNAAFLSVWSELRDRSKDDLIRSLETALRPSTPPEVLQVLLNLAEFMEREGRALPLLQDESKDQPTLGRLAERCHAFAKALHYKEIEFKSAPQDTIESLISINNDLQQPDAAVGILKCAQDMAGMELQPTWYEKLQRWEDALEEYEVLQLRDQASIKHTLGRMRCLDALGLWSRMSNMCDHIWKTRLPPDDNDGDDNTGWHAAAPSTPSSSRVSNLMMMSEKEVLSVAKFGASAAWELRDWEGMIKYVKRMPDGTLDTCIFKCVLAIQREEYESALNLISIARKAVFPELRSLVAESYNRAYGHMVKVQVLAELEEVVAYKKARRDEERVHIQQLWRNRLGGTQRNIMVWRHILAARKLVLNPEEQIDTIVDFSALARKSQRLALSLQALAPFLLESSSASMAAVSAVVAARLGKQLHEEKKKKFNRLLYHHEVHAEYDRSGGYYALLRSDPRSVRLPFAYPKLCLAYLVHLWDAGYSCEALERLEALVEDTRPQYHHHHHGGGSASSTPVFLPPMSPRSPRGAVTSSSLLSSSSSSSSYPDFVAASTSASPAAAAAADDSAAQQTTRMECYLTLGEWRRKLGGDSPSNLERVLQAYRLATRICKDSYDAWHAYASVHFRLVSLLDAEAKRIPPAAGGGGGGDSKKGEDADGGGGAAAATTASASSRKIYQHVIAAIEGFFRCIALAGPNRSTLQDVLRLLTLWFSHGGSEHPQVNAALSRGFNTTSIHTWLTVIPQIIARIYTVDPGVRKLVEQLLRKIGKEHPQALIYPLTVASKSQIAARRKAAEGVMNYMRKYSKKLVDQAELISSELIRVAILWHEMWHDALEEASKFWFGKRNIEGMLQVVEPLHQLMAKGPQTMREVAFQQRYGRELIEAKEWLDRYKVSSNESDLNQAWDAYCNVWRRINKNKERLVTVDLHHASPKLKAVRHLELAVPGTYEKVVSAANLIRPHALATAAAAAGTAASRGNKRMQPSSKLRGGGSDNTSSSSTNINTVFQNQYHQHQDSVRAADAAAAAAVGYPIMGEGVAMLMKGNDEQHYYQHLHSKGGAAAAAAAAARVDQDQHLQHFGGGSKEYGNSVDEGMEGKITRIAWFEPRLKVIESKQRPRKLTIIGSDGLEYSFLLKGHEDLRQDERVMQLFGLVNTLLATDDQTTQKNLNIHRYSVIPLAPNSGLIQWLENCDTLHSLIKEYRDARAIMIQVETMLIKAFSNRVYEQLTVIEKIEVFEYALSRTSGLDLYHVLWLKSQDSETWLDRRTNYTRSLAVMCMVGYILGLGDRHPCNLMLDQFSGKIIHIDFGDCFEVAMQREKFPEKIPFRLTRMLINAMEVSGIEGNFRSTCEAVMRVLRGHKESVMAVLEAFVYDPLINWRLLQTKVSRLHENPEQKEEIEEDDNDDDEKGSGLSESSAALLGREEEAAATENNNNREGVGGTGVLNQKALKVIGRIADKLDGKDFGDGEPLNVPQQVEKLIRQATSHANLSQCYIGWCPFW